MASKGADMFPRKSYGLTADAEKPRVTGVGREELLEGGLVLVSGTGGPSQPLALPRKPLNFQNLPEHLDQLLQVDSEDEESQGHVEGRLGPSTVVLDHTGGFEGLLLVDDDLLGVIGHSNFGTIRSTTCVYKGKWVYEVLISSQGLMQIGWCTINCRFNQEVRAGPQGAPLPRSSPTSSCLNGMSLGTAFENLSRGPGMAYFPAISLSFKESVAFNFGSRPLRYPFPRRRGLLGSRGAGGEGLGTAGRRAHVCLGRGRARVGLRVPGGGAPSQPAPLLPRGPRAGLCRLSVRSPPAPVVEELQVQILKLLLNNKDENGGEASRYIFLTKFRKFLQENASGRGNIPLLCPPEYMVCFLHRLISALRCYWDEYTASNPHASASEEAYVPPQVFYNGKVDYFDQQRLGGLLSHLRKTLKDDLASKANILIDPLELQAATMDDLDEDQEPSPAALQRPVQALAIGGALRLPRPGWLSSPTLGRANRFLSTAAVTLMTPRRPLSASEKVKVRTLSAEQRTREDRRLSLQMVGVSDDVNEYAMALRNTEDKLRRCPKRRKDILEELTKSQKVFSEKLDHLSRRLAWVHATVYSQEKMLDIYWLLRVCLRTIEHADRTGPLFAFMPEFYLSVAINSYSALKNYFGPVHSMEELPGYEETLTRLAAILAKHFADTRIVGTDIRDSLMQALASYVCYPHSLRAVERIPEEQRVAMVRSLLAPYEQRPWAQTNWILVRLWKGCGFGYRYTRLPHLLKIKPEDANLPSLQKPCPSILLQQHMADLLRQDPDVAPSFLNSVLNQLNWAFSEFIGMIQEIQQAVERLERNFVDTRQLKVCATCFDLSVSLLRVLEMTVTLVPEVFLDPTQPTSEMLLQRLAQFLGRAVGTHWAPAWALTPSPSLGLESVDHYPILVAVTGILVRLLVHGPAAGTEKATSVLLADPCFQLRSIRYLLGHPEPPGPGTAPPAPDRKHFLPPPDTDYISSEELAQVEQMLAHLTSASAQAAAASLPTSEEDLCPICYAHPISAVFQPCGHKSCKACINQHLMNNKDCFFCKATIESVEDWRAGGASNTSSAA
ncbi:PREDICTED: E3 ubiquitin-protein ligase RNF123 [Myotis davidii]|uniref:E3 ubiquitin-protein ligase RNF123 n=1 Tax=Myotis davidii TaxID=225400 RepID=UPI000766ED47|nr:PREDICTED: E3 ubiquitin-protein ligase RNF123 [Myotis davidii]